MDKNKYLENYYKEKDGKKVPVNLSELSNNYLRSVYGRAHITYKS